MKNNLSFYEVEMQRKLAEIQKQIKELQNLKKIANEDIAQYRNALPYLVTNKDSLLNKRCAEDIATVAMPYVVNMFCEIAGGVPKDILNIRKTRNKQVFERRAAIIKAAIDFFDGDLINQAVARIFNQDHTTIISALKTANNLLDIRDTVFTGFYNTAKQIWVDYYNKYSEIND